MPFTGAAGQPGVASISPTKARKSHNLETDRNALFEFYDQSGGAAPGGWLASDGWEAMRTARDGDGRGVKPTPADRCGRLWRNMLGIEGKAPARHVETGGNRVTSVMWLS